MGNDKEQKKVMEPLLPERKFPSLGWVFIIVTVGLILLSQFAGTMKMTNWQIFKTTMLAEHDVAKIDVVNNEMVEVYIKKESLAKSKYSDVRYSLAKYNNPGPHYYFSIGSVDVFERDLKEAQADFRESEKIEVNYIKKTNWWNSFLLYGLPILVMVIFWVYISRSMYGGKSGGISAFDFGKSRAHEYETGKLSTITFNDIAGCEEAKTEVMEVVEFLKHPSKFTRLGAKIPKGILLMGPPGTGKTHMAKAVAGEAGVPFFSLSGSEFVEMFVGVGAARVRDLFKKAKERSPSIVFIDEIDAIGRVRGAAVSVQSNDERESTLNQLLAEMDGFDATTNVIVIAATNRADILDSALLRPGRFDRHIFLELPDKVAREAIFKIHIKPLVINSSIDVKRLASQTPGFSGADIANVCNEAALFAARGNKNTVEQNDFLNAIDRIIGGPEKKNKIISPEEKRIIAYHESGHAVVSWNLETMDPLIKISIIPRGRSLGMSMFLPEERQLFTRKEIVDRICVALGGRIAEELVFGEVTSGALDDLERATKEAYSMVTILGLSDKLGNISFYDSERSYDAFQKPYSEATARLIDSEVRNIIRNAHEITKNILKNHRDKLDELAAVLLDKEVAYKEDLERILGKKETKQEQSAKEHELV